MPAASVRDARQSTSGSESDADREEVRLAKRRRVEFALDGEGSGLNGETSAVLSAESFTPPAGLKRATGSGAQLSQFDSETLRQKLATGCQLWAIRLPEGFKLRHLTETSIKVPKNSKTSEKLGVLSHKKVQYDIVSVGSEPEAISAVGAGEMLSFTALCPDRKGRTYSTAPMPISHHIVIKQALSFPPAVSSVPVASNGKEDTGSDDDSEPTKRSQPAGLNGFFAPYGFHTKPDFARPDQPSSQQVAPNATPTETDPTKEKKRRKDRKSLPDIQGDASMDISAQLSQDTPVKKSKKSRKSEKSHLAA